LVAFALLVVFAFWVVFGLLVVFAFLVVIPAGDLLLALAVACSCRCLFLLLPRLLFFAFVLKRCHPSAKREDLLFVVAFAVAAVAFAAAPLFPQIRRCYSRSDPLIPNP